MAATGLTLTNMSASVGHTGIICSGTIMATQGANGPGSFIMKEADGNGVNYSGFTVGNMAANVVYVLPTNDGSNGQVLKTNGSAVLSWADDNNDGSVSGNTFATDLKVGRDADNLLDFTTDNAVVMRVNGVDEIKLVENALSPNADDGCALGSANLNWSDVFLADGAVINFGDDQDVTLTHNADLGVTLSTTATGDSNTTSGYPILTLGSSEDEVANGEFLGAISFAALGEDSGTDAILSAAGIAAVAEDTFAADNNSCGLHFSTATSGLASSKMNLNKDGDLHLSTDTVLLEFGADADVSLQHVADTGLLLNSNMQLQFRDSGLYIGSNADGDLDIVSDGTAVDSINIESAGGITLDAGTNTHGVTYEDDGTAMLRITHSSSDACIVALVQDKDILFKGDDGGSGITALQLDMSDGGTAIFNHDVLPGSAGQGDLGSSSAPWGNVFTQDLHLNNGRGDWVLIEEPDYLTIRNNANGRRYKLLMEDITDSPGAYGPANDGSM